VSPKTAGTGAVGRESASGVPPRELSPADRRARRAMLLTIIGIPVVMVVAGLGQIALGVASPGGDESELVRGWTGVLRSLPGYALGVGVAGAAVVLASRGRRTGAATGGTALVVSCVGLLFVLGSCTRDIAEVVMTTRSATVSWLLFLADAGFVVTLSFPFRARAVPRRPPTAR
ncbi:MAG: hypothetical protein ACKOOG_15160, partial [Actinomycetota bacterium]